MASWAYRSKALSQCAATAKMAISWIRAVVWFWKRTAAPSRANPSPAGGESSIALNGPYKPPAGSVSGKGCGP